jgi:hypothetical protein
VSIPKWLSDIGSFAPLSTHFIVSGNVRDVYPVNARLTLIENAIWTQLRNNGIDALLLWRPYEGLKLAFSKKLAEVPEAAVRRACGLETPAGAVAENDSKSTELVRTLTAWGTKVPPLANTALVVDCVGNLNGMLGDRTFVLGELLERQALSGDVSQPPIFWITPNANDVPYWFTGASSRIRQIVVPLPDRAARTTIGKLLFDDQHFSEGLKRRNLTNRNAFGEELAEATHNHDAVALRSIVSILANDSVRNTVDASQPGPEIQAAATRFRLGNMEKSPWELGALEESIANAEAELNAVVIGQTKAAEQVSNILFRSFAGLRVHMSANRARDPEVYFSSQGQQVLAKPKWQRQSPK